MTQEELDKRIETILAENRAVTEKADAYFREFDRLAPIRIVTTERAIRRLREAARRR